MMKTVPQEPVPYDKMPSCPVPKEAELPSIWQTEYTVHLNINPDMKIMQLNAAYKAVPAKKRMDFVWHLSQATLDRLFALDGNPLAVGQKFMRGRPVKIDNTLSPQVIKLRYDPEYARTHQAKDTVVFDSPFGEPGEVFEKIKEVADQPAGFKVKDSGKRENYRSGMRRDTQEGKPDYTLIDPVMLERWAAHMTKGAVKYGRENWRMADSEEELLRFRASAFRHFMQWLNGEIDEDHAAAVMFNITSAEYVKKRINNAVVSERSDDGIAEL